MVGIVVIVHVTGLRPTRWIAQLGGYHQLLTIHGWDVDQPRTRNVATPENYRAIYRAVL